MDAITALGHPSGTFESQRMDFLDEFFLPMDLWILLDRVRTSLVGP
jgi:hypothetical protein